jgi:group I intron endonuclease
MASFVSRLVIWVAPDAMFWSTLRAIPPDLSGIYALVHLPTGRMYVGFSGNIRERLLGHLADLRWGYHRNEQLTQAWTHDGPHAFHVTVLEPVPDKLRLPEREDFWIDKLRTLHPCGFNKRKNVNVRLSPHLARRYATDTKEWKNYWAETKARLTVARKGRRRPINLSGHSST